MGREAGGENEMGKLDGKSGRGRKWQKPGWHHGEGGTSASEIFGST